jgi:uncharacterized membrane protein
LEVFVDYRERLIWGQFLPIVVAYGYSVIDAVRRANGAKPWPVVPVMVAIAVVIVLYAIVVAALTPTEPRDERTRLIEYKGYKVAYVVVMTALVLLGIAYVLGPSDLSRTLTQPGLMVSVWFGAEAVRTGTQLMLYRASVRA